MFLIPSHQSNNIFSQDYFEQDDICRFCWSKDAQVHLYQTMEKNNSKNIELLIYKVKYVLDIHLEVEDFHKHPNRVCETCFSKIENFYDFKVISNENHRKLHEIINHLNCNVSRSIEEPPNNVKHENFDNLSEIDLNNAEMTDTVNAEGIENTIYNDNIKIRGETENKSINSRYKHEKLDDLSEIDLNNAETDTVNENGIENRIYSDNIKIRGKTENKSRKSRYKLKRTKYYCNICCFNYKNEDAYLNHNSEAHGIEKDGNYKCFGCDKRFKSMKHRVNHETLFCKGLKEGFKCSICNHFLPSRRIYEGHLRDHRQNKEIELPEYIFKCKRCLKQFKNKESLQNHTKMHNAEKKKYICEACGRIFRRQDYLHRHKLTHSGDKPHCCPHCDFRTAQRSSLTVHIRKHTGDRPYACPACPQRCVSASNLRAHTRRHTQPPAFQCAACPKKFGYKLSLQEHIESVHEKSKRHPCLQCGLVYSRIRGLKRHLLAKHSGDHKTNTVENTESIDLGNTIENSARNELKFQTENATVNLETEAVNVTGLYNKNENIPNSNVNVAPNASVGRVFLKMTDKIVCVNKSLNSQEKGGDSYRRNLPKGSYQVIILQSSAN